MLKGMTRYAALLAAFAAQCFVAARADVRELVSAGKITWSSSATAIYLNGSTVVGTNTIDSASAYDNLVLVYTDSDESADNRLSVDESIKAGARILAVGGGGAGGSGFGSGNNRGVGGGGGAGGMLETNDVRLAGGIYEIVVGAGGDANVATDAPVAGGNGNSSLFKSATETILEAFGGGGGGAESDGVGGTGFGSGGGGSLDVSGTTHSGGSGGQGQNGGDGTSANSAGGGGGAGSEGGVGSKKNVGGTGGDGLATDITGEEVYYAGGGGGGTKQASVEASLGAGGLGGGGRGAGKDSDPVAGTNGLGGGGGGGSLTAPGANGGSGVVIVRITQAVETQVKVPEIADLTFNGENQVPLDFGIAYTYVSGVTNATTVGEYTFQVKPGPDLTWLGGGDETKTVTWKIAKRLIDKPTLATNLVFAPDTPQAGATFTDDCLQYCTFSDGAVTNAVNAGSYTFTLSLNDKDNTAWADGSTDDFVGNWSIAPQKVAKPVPYEELVYNGTEQRAFASLNYERYELTAGVTNATNGGTYTFTFSLLGNDGSTNYVWNALSPNADPYSGTWTIDQAPNEITKFSVKGWKIGATPNAPEIVATWGAGTAKVTYGFGASESAVSSWTDDPSSLNEPSIWIARAVIDATDSWAGAAKSVAFSLWDNLGDFYRDHVDVTIGARSGATQTLTNFPVLVRISEERMNGFSYSRVGAGGLCFIDAAGNPLPYEIDTWNTSGESLIWVCVSELPPAGATFTVYWNLKEGHTEPANNPADVWDDGFVGVWHLGESALPMKDSSETSSDFTTAGASGIGYAAEGIAGGAVDFGKTGKSHYLLAPDHDELDGFEKMTIEAWTYIVQTNRPTGSDLNAGILGKRKGSGNDMAYYLFDISKSSADQLNSSTQFYIATNETRTAAAWSGGVTEYAGEWTYQAYTFDSSLASNQIGAWTNGVRVQWNTLRISNVPASAADLCLGSFHAGDARNFPGLIDELRISKVARSKDWLRATYETIYTDTFSAPSSEVYIDGLKHDYWVVSPAVDKAMWDASATPAVFTSTPQAHSGAPVTNVIYSVYDTTKTFESLSELTEPGYYRAEFFTVPAEGVEPLSYAIDLHVIKSQPYYDIGGNGGDSGRILLMNNHIGDPGAANVDYQGWYDADNAGAMKGNTPTYWHHLNLNAPAVTSYNLQNGTESMLYKADGSRLWHLVACRHGNTFPTSASEPLMPNPPEKPIQNYLPYVATYSKRITEHRNNQRGTTRSTVGQLVMQNTTDACVYSSCFTNGVGTVYFDAVNGWCRDGENFDNYKLVVEYATSTVDGLEPTDYNSQEITIERIGDEGDVTETITTNLYGKLEGQWQVATMIPFVKDTADGSGEFVKLDATTELALAVANGGTTGNFYRVAAKLDILEPVRFRIRRVTADANWPVDNASFILLDNIIASVPAMRGDLVSAGRYDEAKSGSETLGWEAATSVPYPSKTDDAVVPYAVPEYYVNVGGGTEVDTSTFFSDARMHYRWRYLDQVTNEWKTVGLNPVDGFKALAPLDLPGRACDVEYWFEYTLQAPFYQYVDYSGINKAIAYSEERGTLTNSLGSASTLASAGTDWYFRVREGKSDYSGLYIVLTREGSSSVERVPMTLVDDHVWRGFVQTLDRQAGNISYRVEGIDKQTDGFAEYSPSTNLWYCSESGLALPVSNKLEPAGSGDWTTLTLDATTGYTMFQIDDTTLSLTIVHADYQNFNAWSDARGQVFLGSSTEDAAKSGTSPKKQTFKQDFDTWSPMLATDTNWKFSHYTDVRNLLGHTPAYTPFSSDTDNYWTAGPGMWIAKKYMHDTNNAGVALQMEGNGKGYLQFVDANFAPRGVESVTFNARLGQAIEFTDFSYYWGDLISKMQNYTFMTRAAFDLNSNKGFAGNASLSLVANYLPGKGCYEARWEWTGTELYNYWNSKGQRLSLYKWTVDKNGITTKELISAWTNNISTPPATTGLGTSQAFTPYFISVSNDTATASTWVLAGVRPSSTGIKIGETWSNYGASWYGIRYRDTGKDRLSKGTYGVLSSNCDGVFARPQITMTSIPDCASASLADDKSERVTNTTFQVASLTGIRDCVEDFKTPEAEDDEINWYIRPGRMATTNVSSDVNGILSKPVPQTIAISFGSPGRDDFSAPVENVVVSGFGGSAKTVNLYKAEDCSIRFAVQGGSSGDTKTDVVIDTLSLKQFRGDDYSNGEEVQSLIPNWSDPYSVDPGHGLTNWVFTCAWITNSITKSGSVATTNGMMLLSAKRATADKVSSVRSPLMDGVSPRGTGLGMLSFDYLDAQVNARLLVQIATNDVKSSTLERFDSPSPDLWTTVETIDFSTMSESQRKKGTVGVYIGLHGVKGLMRIVVDPALVASVATVTDKARFGEVKIDNVLCRDEPSLDTTSWWGWNLRMVGSTLGKDEEGRMYLPDLSTSLEDVGMSLALNNSVTADTDRSDPETYRQNVPFVQTPTFSTNIVGEVSFKARKYNVGSGQPASVTLYGSKTGSEDSEWTTITNFVVASTLYDTFTYKTEPGDSYSAFRLGVSGVPEVDNSGSVVPAGYALPVRVLIDEVTVSEAVRARLGFRNVGVFRSGLSSTGYMPNVPSVGEQPLCDEGWGVQCEVFAAQLENEIDMTRDIQVVLHWFEGTEPWGYENWRTDKAAHSAPLAPATETNFIYRSSYVTSPGAVVPMSTVPGTVVQYMLEVRYFQTGASVVSTNYLTSADWTRPDWYRPVDYNADYGRASGGFAAYNILDSVAPGWAWINEVNLYGLYDYDWNNSEDDAQFVEIAVPVEANITDWKLRFITGEMTEGGSIWTNTVAVFGTSELPGTKPGNIGEASNMVFRVIGCPKAMYMGTLKEYDGTPDSGTLDGVWDFTADATDTLLATGEIMACDPIAIQLVRPSGIVEHEVVCIGTNYYGRTPGLEMYSPEHATTYLNNTLKGAAFINVGEDCMDRNPSGKYRSLGVFEASGRETNQWNNVMKRTPGRINEDQVITPDHPTPNGESIMVFCSVDSSVGHIRQTVGEAVETNAMQTIYVKRGSDVGTNIVYTVDPWYQLASVTTNGQSVAFRTLEPRRYEVTVGVGASNNVTVVATAKVDDRLVNDFGLTEDNVYTPAVVDWLTQGEDLMGNPWPNAGSDEILLADFIRPDGTVITNLNLTQMYWLDMDPTVGNLALKGYISDGPSTTNMAAQGGSTYTNLRFDVFMQITNRASGDAWAPYALRGKVPGSSSLEYTNKTVAAGWTSATFKMVGIINNGLTGFNVRDFWVPLRWFVFTPSSFRAPGSDKPFTTTIDIVDPFSQSSPACEAGWYKWAQEHGKPQDFYFWCLDERLVQIDVRVLKEENPCE